MVSKRNWNVINVSLVFLLVLLTANFFGVQFPSIGQARYALNTQNELMVVQWEDQFNECTNINRCCFEARTVSNCRNEEIEFNGKTLPFVCGTESTLQYHMNSKAHLYCQLQRFW